MGEKNRELINFRVNVWAMLCKKGLDSLLNNKILDQSKLNTFVADKRNATQKFNFVL